MVPEQGMHHRHWSLLLTQAKVEEEKNPTQLISTGPQDPGDDTILTCTFVLVQSLQVSLHLAAGDRQVAGEGRGGAQCFLTEGKC